MKNSIEYTSKSLNEVDPLLILSSNTYRNMNYHKFHAYGNTKLRKRKNLIKKKNYLRDLHTRHRLFENESCEDIISWRRIIGCIPSINLTKTKPKTMRILKPTTKKTIHDLWRINSPASLLDVVDFFLSQNFERDSFIGFLQSCETIQMYLKSVFIENCKKTNKLINYLKLKLKSFKTLDKIIYLPSSSRITSFFSKDSLLCESTLNSVTRTPVIIFQRLKYLCNVGFTKNCREIPSEQNHASSHLLRITQQSELESLIYKTNQLINYDPLLR